MTNSERQRNYRRRNPERAGAVRRSYRQRNSKWETDASYLAHPFMAWDGEGITRDGRHDYVMLACKSSDGTSDDLINVNPGGLSTIACLEFLLSHAHTDRLNVIYGGSYDVNMMLRDVPREKMLWLYKKGTVRWSGYRMLWRPGKRFYVCRVDGEGNRVGKGITLYDVVSFFQCPFVKACDEYLGARFAHREMIVQNKALRSTFTLADVPHVRRYNDAELDNLIMLMEELRLRLNRCTLRPRSWDGPGAIAAALMLREGVKEHMSKEIPADVARAARFAYAGGRFEVIRFGHVKGKAYEYDVNSAYPTALRNVPSLAGARWKRYTRDPGARPFALYRVEYRGNNGSIPGALFRRDSNGTISYPLAVTGWYWSPEIEVAREYCRRGYGTMRVLSAYVCEPVTDVKPFAFIDPLYLKRKALKKGKDGAHVGIKLGLNSLYGKLAQQVGARQDSEGNWRIPPFHQIEWAGYVTSHCRASVLRACLDKLDSVIAFETDAVFTSEPLNVTIGDDLGDFERVEFDDLTYVQSGMYFGMSEGKEIAKTRGVDRGSLTRADVLKALRNPRADDRIVSAKLTRFVGAGIALAQSWSRWRKWETITKRMVLEPTGKRVHMDCACMRVLYDNKGGIVNKGLVIGLWHRTACPLFNDTHSCEFPVVWINPNDEMTDLEEMRREESEWE